MDIIRALWSSLVLVVLIAVGMQLSGCATRSVEAGGPGWSYHSDSSASPLHSSEQVRMQSQVPGYGFPGAYGVGYGGFGDHFGYVQTQYAGTEFDPAMAGVIRPPPPVPRPQASTTSSTPEISATTPSAIQALVEETDALDQRLRPLEDMHCRRHPRRCRQGGSR